MEQKNDLKERFLKIYANLPINIREEIIYVLDDKSPLTWNAVFIEINNNTDLGKKILMRLFELSLI